MIHGAVLHASPHEPSETRVDLDACRALVAPPREGWLAYMGKHGQSFRFASRFMEESARTRVAAVYAFCRFTDDLVDCAEGKSATEIEAQLDAWLALARAEYVDAVVRPKTGVHRAWRRPFA